MQLDGVQATDQQVIANDNWRAYQWCRESGHEDYVRTAQRCDAYYNGDQWTPADKAKLEAVRRPALTLNNVTPLVNTLLGEQISQRAEVTFRPKRHGGAELAELHSRLYHHILETNQYRYLETMVFGDGIVQDRGYFNVTMDFSDHLSGEVRLEVLDPLDVLLDPESKDYDPALWKQVIVTRWMTLDDVAVLYGEGKAKQLESSAALNITYGADSLLTGAANSFGDRRNYMASTVTQGDYQQITRVRIIDRQYRKLERVPTFVDTRTGDMREVPPSWDKARVATFQKKHRLEITPRLMQRVRWTVTADHVVLHDEWSPYGGNFTVVPFFPMFRRGKPTGLVRHLLDPQDQYNKISSQELHVVNITANGGWIMEAGSLLNLSEQELEERGAESGLVLVTRPGAPPPAKIQPNNVPAGLDRLALKAKMDLRETSGVEALLGQESNTVSGVAMQSKQSRALTLTKVPFDNLNRTRTLLAQLVLSMVQQFYTEQRVYFITQWDQPQKPAVPLEVNTPDAEGHICNDLTVGEYEVSVAVVPSRDTYDDVQFAEAIQLREAGVLIPDDVVIEYSHLSRRDEVAARVRKVVGGGDPTPEEIQLAQQKMQMDMNTAQAKLDELRAKAQLLAAQAQLTGTKSETMLQEAEGAAQMAGANHQMDQQRLQADILTKLAVLQNKIDLAKLHSTVNVTTTAMQNEHKTALEHMRAVMSRQTNENREAPVT